MGLASVPDSQHQNIRTNKGVDHSVVPHSQLVQPFELSAQGLAAPWVDHQILSYVMKYPLLLRPRNLPEVVADG